MCKHLGWEETLALLFSRRNCQEERVRTMMREKCTKKRDGRNAAGRDNRHRMPVKWTYERNPE